MNEAQQPLALDEARRRQHAGWIAELTEGGRRRETAMERLFHAYEARVVGWCRYQFRLSLQEAEDIWQEAVISICRSAQEFHAGSDPRAWIFTIARNKALDLLKCASRRHEQLSDDDSDPADQVAAPAPSEVDPCVQRGFARFAAEHPEPARWILKADIEGHDIPEMAAQLQRTEGATRTYLKTLRSKLRPYIAPCLELLQA